MIIDFAFKAITLIVTVVQYRVSHSRLGKFCVKLDLLSVESTWLNSLVILQIVKIVFFTIWQYLVEIGYFRDKQHMQHI